MAYQREHPCGYENCYNTIARTEAGGREKKYCNSTCRSNQFRLNADRAATKAVIEEQERRFQEYVAGVRPDLHPDLREILKKDGQNAFFRAIALAKKACLIAV